VTALAARRTLFEKLTKIKLPAPRIDPCIRIGELSSSIFYFRYQHTKISPMNIRLMWKYFQTKHPLTLGPSIVKVKKASFHPCSLFHDQSLELQPCH
jgi:hypothetical protein